MASSSFPFSRRRLLTTAGIATAGGLLGVGAARAVSAPSSYTPTWSSVDQHLPAPEWFQDAKFGIYFHWGVFSVPAFANEWYPRNMYNNGSNENNHHKSVFGDPSVWPYHNFINGARDKAGNWVQFAPKLKSAGGNFDPNEWAQLFADAGAKFAGPVAEHHDGYSMWNSRVNEWNSVATGPRLDLLRLHADAIRAKGLKLLVSLHHAFNFTGFYQWAPSQSTATLMKLYGQLDRAAENQLWYDKLKEVIDGYQPDIIWQDFNLSQVPESQRLNFLAYYYNQAIAWNKDAVATYKDGFNTRGEVFDYERGGPADIQTPYWLTDDSISSSSWCYTVGIGYYALNAMLHALIDRVSKNGNMLLNIAPMADGTIPSGQRRQRRLRLGAQAVELRRQHQPAVAAGGPGQRLVPHRQPHQQHGRRQLGEHRQRRLLPASRLERQQQPAVETQQPGQRPLPDHQPRHRHRAGQRRQHHRRLQREAVEP